MRAQRTWKVAGDFHHASIEQLQLELAALNRCIGVIGKADADPHDLELLTDQALTLAERIDEARCSKPAEALGWLLEKANLKTR